MHVAAPPDVALRCPVIFPSGTTPLDIHECVEDLSDLGNSGNAAQTLPLCECSGVWYFERNYEPEVPPASFCEVGSWGPPMTRQLISSFRQPLLRSPHA